MARAPLRFRRCWIALWLLGLLATLDLPAQADRRRFEAVAAARDLNVRALAEDRQGLIWVGHSEGLLRLDGTQARPLPVAESPVPVRALLLQGDDLLIAHGAGLSRWQRRDESLAVLPCPAQPMGYRSLQATPRGVYAFGSTLALLDPDGARCEAVPLPDLPAPVEAVWWQADHLWLAARDQGLWQCALPCTQARRLPGALEATRVRWISDHAEGGLWVGTHRHGLYHLRADGTVADRWWRGDDAPIDRALPTNGTLAVLPGRDRTWVGLWAGGLIGIAADGAVDLRARPEPRLEGSVGGEDVAALLESRTGSLLVGHDQGLDLLTPTRRGQFWIGPAGERQAGLPRPEVQRLLWHGGRLWAGMNRGGLARVDTEGRVSAVGAGEVPGQALPSGAIWSLAAAGPDTLVLATSGGVARLHVPSGQIRSLAHTPTLPSDDVVALAPAPDGDWWLGVWAGGAVRIDGDGVARQRWDPTAALGSRNVLHVHGDRVGRAWILADGRVGELLPDGRVQPCPWPDPAIRALSLWPDHDGGLLATTTHGLWARRKEVWQRLDQLPGDARLGVARAIDGGGWWVSHEGALIRLDAAGHEQLRLDRRHGLEAGDLRDVAIGPDQRLWLATEQGIYRLDSRAPAVPDPPVTPVLRGLRLFNAPLAPTPDRGLGLRASALLGGPLTLAYDQDLLTLEYARPGLPAPIGLRYRHRLEPFDTRWTETPADEARAVYTRLPPGEYRFQVEAGDAAAWHPGRATLALTVLPPWWMTWWARGTALLGLLAGIGAVFRLRTLQLRRQAQALERKVAERTAELEAANRALATAAVTDPLTRLLNRRGFIDWLQDPHWPADAVLMLCDIDHFKRINDTWGHDVGDAVLIEVAARLRAAVQPDDVLARWGGEEFVIFLRGAEPAARAAGVRTAVGATPLTIEPGPPRVTLSAGAARVTDGADLDQRLKRADERLYRAKQAGRDRLVAEG